jgi:predicted enzyme related to lactoylglutathione lyase
MLSAAEWRVRKRPKFIGSAKVIVMAEPRTYPHGVTSWIDTEQPDLEAARMFYAGLFGWTLTDPTLSSAQESYLIATLDGQDVAALGAVPAAGPARWNTYVAVNDADATAAAVIAGGGTLIVPPADAGQAGRAATCADPFGAEFRLWQAGTLLGAQRTNSPGAWNFSDLYTPDRDAAMAFYTPLFGWRAADLDQGAGTMLQVPGYGDHLAATVDPGIHERQASAPAGFADVIGGLVVTSAGQIPRWHVTFTVADRDDSTATAERLGATVVSLSDNQWTKDALLRDPQGAEFTVSQFTPPDGDW